MKMVIIAYNESMDSEVMDVLEHCALKNYTKLPSVFGKGTTSGSHQGTDIWPGKNNVLLVGCEDKDAKQLFSCVRNLKKKFSAEGIKGFILPLEEIT